MGMGMGGSDFFYVEADPELLKVGLALFLAYHAHFLKNHTRFSLFIWQKRSNPPPGSAPA